MRDFNDPAYEPGWKRRARKAREAKLRREAREIYELQMREAIIRWTRERIPDEEIAKRLGQSILTIQKYRDRSLQGARGKNVKPESRARPSAGRGPAPRALPAPGARASTDRTAGSGASSSSFSKSGEILEAQDVLEMRAHCLKMKKAAVPYDKMAEILGISKKEAQQYCRDAIAELQESEQLNSDLERRLMIEQIDQMIAAIHAPATGENLLGYRVTVVFEAIDRMLRLMKAKSDLLGLSAPPAVDIRIKLQGLASESGYDIVDLEEIAREVLQAHKLKLPEFR